MRDKRGKDMRERTGRSAEQRRVSAAMVLVMQAWEELSDEERLAWDSAGSLRRMKGINYFKQVNLRRLLRGEELTRVPLPSKGYDPKPLIKGLDIRNRGGRITLELELFRKPDGLWTVWASLPSNLGVKKPRECPRLGRLPVLQGRWCEITTLYFKKYGAYIKQHGLQLVGKRIFVRLRQELDEGVPLYEQVRGVVPKPEVPMGKKGPSSSKEVRRRFEGASKGVRNITPVPRPRLAGRALRTGLRVAKRAGRPAARR